MRILRRGDHGRRLGSGAAVGSRRLDDRLKNLERARVGLATWILRLRICFRIAKVDAPLRITTKTERINEPSFLTTRRTGTCIAPPSAGPRSACPGAPGEIRRRACELLPRPASRVSQSICRL